MNMMTRILTVFVLLPALLAGCATSNISKEKQKEKTLAAARANTQLGVEYLRKGEYETSLKKLNKALDIDPDYADAHDTLAVLYESLKDDFGVPQVAARLWHRVLEQSYLPELAACSDELRDYADSLGSPYCGPTAPLESRGWFEAPDEAASFAFLPLRTSYTFGLLGLASDDPQRFVAGMGTVYLTRLGELASVAMARYLPPA